MMASYSEKSLRIRWIDSLSRRTSGRVEMDGLGCSTALCGVRTQRAKNVLAVNRALTPSATLISVQLVAKRAQKSCGNDSLRRSQEIICENKAWADIGANVRPDGMT